MGQPLENHQIAASANMEPWAVRLAPCAQAAWLEGRHGPTRFRIAELRNSAISAVSALSVDDRGLIAGRQSVQLLNASATRMAHDLGMLAKIDRPLAAAVRAQRPPDTQCGWRLSLAMNRCWT